jgi:hypothetical protein
MNFVAVGKFDSAIRCKQGFSLPQPVWGTVRRIQKALNFNAVGKGRPFCGSFFQSPQRSYPKRATNPIFV